MTLSLRGFKLRTLKYYITEAGKSLWRNSLMTLTSVATVASCVFIVIVSICITVNVSFFLKQFESSVGLTVFIDESVTVEGVSSLYEELMRVPHIKTAEFVTAQKALEEFAKSLGDSQGIVIGLEKVNPLRRSFNITLDDVRNQNAVLADLNTENFAGLGIANIRDAKIVTEPLVAINNALRVVFLFIIAILGLLSVVIIMNTIKLTVNSRKNEISIMKYVGATESFIRWPFLMEGMFIGVLGSFFPIFICFTGYDGFVRLVLRRFSFLDTMVVFRNGADIFPWLTPMMMLLGGCIGLVGSITSLRRYLNA